MDASLVDHNRNNECSNGLHVARRGYIKQFPGNVCTLCKVAPEDVIAVPTYDANKMRVCGYHIIFELTPEEYALVNQNKPISDIHSGSVRLARAIKGDHICRTHEVRITGQKGSGVVTKELDVHVRVPKAKVEPVEALSNPSKEKKAAVVQPKQVAAKAKQQAKASPKKVPVKAAPTNIGSPRERIQKLLAVGLTSTGVAKAILGLKKQAKKGWEPLGVSEAQAKEIVLLAQAGS
jgi:hypothetical protein